MSDFVDCHCGSAFISDNNSWGGEGKEWVFHASEGERRGEDNKFVITPDIGNSQSLEDVHVLAKVGEFICDFFNYIGFGDNVGPVIDLLLDDISGDDGNHVAGNWDFGLEIKNVVIHRY